MIYNADFFDSKGNAIGWINFINYKFYGTSPKTNNSIDIYKINLTISDSFNTIFTIINLNVENRDPVSSKLNSEMTVKIN